MYANSNSETNLGNAQMLIYRSVSDNSGKRIRKSQISSFKKIMGVVN